MLAYEEFAKKTLDTIRGHIFKNICQMAQRFENGIFGLIVEIARVTQDLGQVAGELRLKFLPASAIGILHQVEYGSEEGIPLTRGATFEP